MVVYIIVTHARAVVFSWEMKTRYSTRYGPQSSLMTVFRRRDGACAVSASSPATFYDIGLGCTGRRSPCRALCAWRHVNACDRRVSIGNDDGLLSIMPSAIATSDGDPMTRRGVRGVGAMWNRGRPVPLWDGQRGFPRFVWQFSWLHWAFFSPRSLVHVVESVFRSVCRDHFSALWNLLCPSPQFLKRHMRFPYSEGVMHGTYLCYRIWNEFLAYDTLNPRCNG